VTGVALINCERETVAFAKLVNVSWLAPHSWFGYQSLKCSSDETLSVVKRMDLWYDMATLFRSILLKLLRGVFIYAPNYLAVLRHCLQTAQTQAILYSWAKFFFLWRCSPTQAMASSFLRFADHTQWHNTLVSTPVDEWSASHKDLYLTTHNTHQRQIYMPLAGFEPASPESGRPQTHAVDCAATEIGTW
jgi:hypothetical protein